MLPRGSRRKRKKASTLSRVLLMVLTVVLIFSSGIWGDGAKAEYGIPIKDIPKLSKVGPILDDNGYPVWYRDFDGTRLELCLDVNNPLCALDPAEIPRPLEPISLKTGNFPGEAFYQLAGSEIAMPSGGRAIATFALEAAWANEIVQDGDQIVFGRVRLRIDDLVPGQKYTITHPYGIDIIEAVVADEDEPNVGEIRFVEDIGINGGFEGAKTSRIGSFLEWDTGAPEGYIGDPNVDHRITGGINNQNFFRIQGPGVGTGTCGQNCIETDLFSLMGKKATTAGVDIARATYSQDTAGGGTIDVFAATEEDTAYTIDVKGDGISPTTMQGSKGQYFGRVTFTGNTPNKVIVTNTTDNPDSVKELIPVDYIMATAKYDTNSGSLFVTASSSDKVEPPTLTVTGFEDIPENGILAIKDPKYVPPTITVTSSVNGSVTVPVEVTTVPSSANPGVAQTVKQGSLVTLDGSASINAATYKWEQVSGPEVQLNLENPAKPTFTFPKKFIPVSFKLTVTGNDGKSSTNESIVTITPEPDKLMTSEVSFATSTSTLKVVGTSDVFGPGVNVTVLVGNQSFSTNVLTDGKWSILSRGVTTYKAGDTINIVSTSGGKLTNVPVTIRTR